MRAATLNGAGVALLPRMVAADDLASGRLVRVLPQYAVRGSILYVVYAAARTVPAKIAAFRDLVLSSCAITGASGGVPPARTSQRPPAERAGRARAKRAGAA